jgi:hypothetical protein
MRGLTSRSVQPGRHTRWRAPARPVSGPTRASRRRPTRGAPRDQRPADLAQPGAGLDLRAGYLGLVSDSGGWHRPRGSVRPYPGLQPAPRRARFSRTPVRSGPALCPATGPAVRCRSLPPSSSRDAADGLVGCGSFPEFEIRTIAIRGAGGWRRQCPSRRDGSRLRGCGMRGHVALPRVVWLGWPATWRIPAGRRAVPRGREIGLPVGPSGYPGRCPSR